ncbi:MAG TPA: PKD domain-containing protein [Solirubrobacterales bacterium]
MAAPSAAARNAYVANSGDGTVSVFDTASNAPTGLIGVGGKPIDIAITPDGRFAYVVDNTGNSVSPIDTAANAVAAGPIAVGAGPRGVAIAPNGQSVYVTNFDDDTVSVIATGSNGVVATIPVGDKPDGVAVSPDSTRVFVAQRGGDVSIVDTTTNAVIGSVPDAAAPSRIAIGPRGGRAFVTDSGANSVTAFNPTNGAVVGAPIPVGTNPTGIAIESGGTFAYAASPADGTLTALDTSLDAPVGTLSGFPGATGLAFTPSGATGYVSDGGGSAVTILNRDSGGVAGSISAGAGPTGIAVVPDQGPQASFLVTPQRHLAKRRLTFHAGASADPDGKVADYAWDFGDGGHVAGVSATRFHRYKRPGTYTATLVVTDDEGCSTATVFTGQTASCNGSSGASVTQSILVIDPHGPELNLAGGRRQRLRGRVSVFARCPRESCSVRARGVLIAKTQRGKRGVRRDKRRLIPSRIAQSNGNWQKLGVKVPRGARRAALRALRSHGTATVNLIVIARDVDGIKTLRRRTVKLVVPRD